MPRLYQQLLAGIVSYETLGNRIIERIKIAHAFRQVETVKELAGLLLNIPIKEHQLIGQYYLVWCQSRDGQYSNFLLENIIERSETYKTKALISKAAFEIYKGNTNNALHFYGEAIKTSLTLSEYIEASRGAATVKGLEGFSKAALADLEKLIPIIRHAEPAIYYSVLNSYAVELGEAGRIEEAANISKIVLASPFVFAYPEWRETRNEIALRGYKSRSVVSVSKLPLKSNNVVPMPVNTIPILPQKGCGKVLDLQKLRKKMVKEPNGENGEENKKLSDKQMVMKIMEYATDDDLPDEALFEMLESIKKISRSYKSKKGKD